MALLSDTWKSDILLLLIGSLALAYLFGCRTYTYWHRRGFKSLPGSSFFGGHFNDLISGKMSIGECIAVLHNSTEEPFIGIYGIFRPNLLIRNYELVRTILIKDFSYFTDRGIHSNDSYDPLSGNLFGLRGEKWRNMRTKLSPSFSTAKLKAMFSTIVDCGSTLQNHLDKLIEENELLDVREVAAGFTTNVIASVAFGIDVDTINEPNNEFRVCGRKIFEPSFWNSVRGLLAFIQPDLMSVVRMKIVDKCVEQFLRTIVTQNLEYREKNNVSRKDFFQLLIQLRNSGTVQFEDQWETNTKSDDNQKTLTFDEIVAQTFIFFAGGFETSSSTLSFCLYELAKNPTIQQRVHDEIDEILNQFDGQITYDSILAMKYLESCLDETLRKYPILPFLNRKCVKDYEIPGSNGKIVEKGTQIFISAIALQHDEKYYPNPMKFDPDRFNADKSSQSENKFNRPYLPFGDGPRNCIGLRLGKFQTLIGLVMMLHKFQYKLQSELNNEELKYDPKSFLLTPLDRVELHISKR